MKEYVLNLPYWQQGDDLASYQAHAPGGDAEAFETHAAVMQEATRLLSICASAARQGKIKIARAEGHEIIIDPLDQEAVDRLVATGILDCYEFIDDVELCSGDCSDCDCKE